MEAQRIYRVCGTPVRTGCITCKKRHIKCDEQKPSCRRCIKSRRNCEGYLKLPVPVDAQASVSSSSSSSSSSKSFSLVPTADTTPLFSLSPFPALSPQERHALHAFTSLVGPGLAGYSTSDFFTARVVRSCFSESVVRHAVIGLTTLHQLFKAGLLDPTGNTVPSPGYHFALRHNTMAIRYLKELMSQPCQRMDLTLTACILFVCFDSFLANYQSAMIHLRCGLQILRDIRELDTCLSRTWFSEFSPLIMRLGVQAMTFLHPRSDEDRIGLWGELKIAALTETIDVLQSVEEAQHRLNTIGAEVIYDLGTASIESRSLVCQKQLTALAAWNNALKNLLAGLDMADLGAEPVLRAACLLKVYHNFIFLILDSFDDKDEMFEEILSLTAIIDKGEMIYGSKSPAILDFSSDLGIVAPLFFTGMKCKNMAIRQRAWEELCNKTPRREGMWDAGLCAMVVGRALANLKPEKDGETVNEAETWESCALHQELKLRQKLRMG